MARSSAARCDRSQYRADAQAAQDPRARRSHLSTIKSAQNPPHSPQTRPNLVRARALRPTPRRCHRDARSRVQSFVEPQETRGGFLDLAGTELDLEGRPAAIGGLDDGIDFQARVSPSRRTSASTACLLDHLRPMKDRRDLDDIVDHVDDDVGRSRNREFPSAAVTSRSADLRVCRDSADRFFDALNRRFRRARIGCGDIATDGNKMPDRSSGPSDRLRQREAPSRQVFPMCRAIFPLPNMG